MSGPQDLVERGYDAVYQAFPNSPTLRRLWRDNAAGQDFPDAFYHISFLTVAELQRMSVELRLTGGDDLLDIGCGMAGPSLWIAEQSRARLTGVDLSSVAVAHASARAAARRLSGIARFRTGSFAETGLDTESQYAAMSVDALQYAPDKLAAFTETARVLRGGSRFVFTAFEYEPARAADLPVAGVDAISDYRPALEEAGISIESYEETAGWRERVVAAFGAALSEQDALRREMGETAFNAFMLEAQTTLQLEPYRRRVFVVATRRT